MKNTYATFADPKDAERATGALLDHGIRAEHLSIIFPEGYTYPSYHPDHKVDNDKLPNEDQSEMMAKSGITTTTLADAEVGAAKGARIGLAAGAVAALASVLIPGVGLVLGGGALAIAIGGMAGATAAGAVAGGVTGYLKDQGISPSHTEVYEGVLRAGGALVTVSPTNEKVDCDEICDILAKYHGTISTHPLESHFVGGGVSR